MIHNQEGSNDHHLVFFGKSCFRVCMSWEKSITHSPIKSTSLKYATFILWPYRNSRRFYITAWACWKRSIIDLLKSLGMPRVMRSTSPLLTFAYTHPWTQTCPGIKELWMCFCQRDTRHQERSRFSTYGDVARHRIQSFFPVWCWNCVSILCCCCWEWFLGCLTDWLASYKWPLFCGSSTHHRAVNPSPPPLTCRAFLPLCHHWIESYMLVNKIVLVGLHQHKKYTLKKARLANAEMTGDSRLFRNQLKNRTEVTRTGTAVELKRLHLKSLSDGRVYFRIAHGLQVHKQ